MLRVRGFLMLALFFYTLNCAMAQAGQVEIERFRTEYPEASRRLMSRYAQVNGSCRVSVTEVDNSHLDKERISFAVDHSLRKLTSVAEPTAGHAGVHEEIVDCFNSKGSFSLKRTPGSADYMIIEFGPPDTKFDHFARHLGRFLDSPFRVNILSIAEEAALPSFQILSAQSIDYKGISCLEVNYKVSEPDDPSLINTVSLILDPNYSWVIRRSRFQPGGAPGIEIITDVSYSQDLSDVPILKKVFVQDMDGTDKLLDFERVALAPTPATEFELPYYRLPDVLTDSKITPRNHTTGWLIGIGLVGLILALGLRRVAGSGTR